MSGSVEAFSMAKNSESFMKWLRNGEKSKQEKQDYQYSDPFEIRTGSKHTVKNRSVNDGLKTYINGGKRAIGR